MVTNLKQIFNSFELNKNEQEILQHEQIHHGVCIPEIMEL